MGMTLTLDDLKTALLMPRELAAGFILQYTVSTPPYLVDYCGFKWIKIHINNKTILFSSTLSMSRLFSLQVTMALWISPCKSWWIFYSLVLIFGNQLITKFFPVLYVLPLHVQQKYRVSDLCTGDATVRIFCEQAVEIARPLCCWTDFSVMLPWRCVCAALLFSVYRFDISS